MKSVLKCIYTSRRQEVEKTGKQWPQVLAILIANLSSFSGGQLYTWTSIGIPYLLSKDFPQDVTFEEVSYLAIAPKITTVLFCPLCSFLVDKIGRKPVVIFANVPYLMTWIMLAYSKSVTMFYVALFVEGFGNAARLTAVPSYVAEISEPKVRGSWGAAFTINVYLGQFTINVLGSYLDIKTSSFICAAISTLGLITTPFLPESPYYLLMKGRTDEARNSLKRLRKMNNVEEELTQLNTDVHRQMSESGRMKDLFMIDNNRKSLLIASGLRFFQQFSGITTFFSYSQYIFQVAEGDLSQTTSAMIFTGLSVVTASFGAFLLERFGRRSAITISCIGSAAALTFESVYFYCRDYLKVNVSNFGWVPITGLLLYVVFYSGGLGIGPNILIGELFSASVKGKAIGVVLVVTSVLSIVSTIPFQTLLTSYGLFAPFTIYAVCTYGSIIFGYCCVPETKGKTLEEIQQSMKHTKIIKK